MDPEPVLLLRLIQVCNIQVTNIFMKYTCNQISPIPPINQNFNSSRHHKLPIYTFNLDPTLRLYCRFTTPILSPEFSSYKPLTPNPNPMVPATGHMDIYQNSAHSSTDSSMCVSNPTMDVFSTANTGGSTGSVDSISDLTNKMISANVYPPKSQLRRLKVRYL